MKPFLIAISLVSLLSVSSPAEPPANDKPTSAPKKESQLYPVRVEGKMGYINKAGEIVIAPKYDHVCPMHDGYAIVMVGEKKGLIDREGKVLIKPKYRYDGGLEDVQEGLLLSMTDEG